MSLSSCSWPAMRGVVYTSSVLLLSVHAHCTNWHSIVHSMHSVSSVQSHYPIIVTSNILVFMCIILICYCFIAVVSYFWELVVVCGFMISWREGISQESRRVRQSLWSCNWSCVLVR